MEENKFEKVSLQKGSGVVFNNWLVHRTSDFKNDKKIRIAITLRFNDINDTYFISNQYESAYKTIKKDSRLKICRGHHIALPESQKPRQRVSNADRKVFANPESFCDKFIIG